MNTRILSTRAHGMIGSLAIAAALIAPALLRLQDVPASARALRLWVVGTIALTALTDFELGVVRVLPMPAHLAIDALVGPALAAAPWLMGFARRPAPLAPARARRRHGVPPRTHHRDTAVVPRGRLIRVNNQPRKSLLPSWRYLRV